MTKQASTSASNSSDFADISGPPRDQMDQAVLPEAPNGRRYFNHPSAACARPNSVYLHYGEDKAPQRVNRDYVPLLDIGEEGHWSRRGNETDGLDLLDPNHFSHQDRRAAVLRDGRSDPERRRAYRGIPGLRRR